MKKLLLLALAVGSAVSLSACSVDTQEVEDFRESMAVETRNYTVTYSETTTFFAYTETFNVDGTSVEYVAYNGNPVTSKIYDLKYDTDGVLTSADRYYNNSTSSTSITAESLRSSSYDYVGYAIVSPFDFLIEINEDNSYIDSEVAFSNFKYDSDNEAFYYYSKSWGSEYEKTMDLLVDFFKAAGMTSSEINAYFEEAGVSSSAKASTSSLFSLAFSYDTNGDLDTVEVFVRNTDEEYSFTFSNFGDVTVTIPTAPTESN